MWCGFTRWYHKVGMSTLEGGMATADVGGGNDGGRMIDGLRLIVMWHASVASKITEASHGSQECSRFQTFGSGSISP